MRRTLLISVAVIALAAGGQAAFSQGGSGGGTGGSGAGGGTGSPTMNQSPPSGGGAGGATMNQSPSGAGGSATTGGATRESPAAGSAQSEPQMVPGGQKDRPSKQQQGQAPAQPGKQQQGQAPAPSGGSKQGASGTTTKQGAAESTTTKQGASGGSMTSKSVSLTTEQKTKIRSTVLTGSAPRVTNVNFDVRIGTVVPRTVRVAPLPATIISIEPEWRGYMYFVYNDEIVVVNPRTLAIVAVLDV